MVGTERGLEVVLGGGVFTYEGGIFAEAADDGFKLGCVGVEEAVKDNA